jgi:guanylate kinase
MSQNKNGMMFVLSSPSGVGKTTLTKKISKNNKNFIISISHTTRKPRTNEIDGEDYFFINEREFNKLIEENSFFEHAKIFDNFYGTSKQQVLKIIEQGNDVLFDIDWQGTQQLKKIKGISLVTFFIIPPNVKTLKERLTNRHQGEEKMINKRMEKFSEEISHWNEYNYVLINDNLEKCYEKILELMKLEKKGITEKQDLNLISKKIGELTK